MPMATCSPYIIFTFRQSFRLISWRLSLRSASLLWCLNVYVLPAGTTHCADTGPWLAWIRQQCKFLLSLASVTHAYLAFCRTLARFLNRNWITCTAHNIYQSSICMNRFFVRSKYAAIFLSTSTLQFYALHIQRQRDTMGLCSSISTVTILSPGVDKLREN